jgi:hypothetical protein
MNKVKMPCGMVAMAGSRGPGDALSKELTAIRDEDEVLVDEFCSLVAEIAVRSLTRKGQERDNGEDHDGRR